MLASPGMGILRVGFGIAQRVRRRRRGPMAVSGCLLALAALSALPARAQAPVDVSQPPSTPATTSAADRADISLTLTLRADELRYQVVPTVTVRFTGSDGRETVWDTVHDNLPPAPVAGTTYRNVGIAVTITSTFAAEPSTPTATPAPANP